MTSRDKHLSRLRKSMQKFISGSVTERHLAHWAKDIYFRKSNPPGLSKNHYVYALLDPRFKGPFTYTLTGGDEVRFSHKPFYIGMSSNLDGAYSRMYSHCIFSIHKRSTLILNRVFDLNYYRLSPEPEVVQDKLTRIYAQALESELIRSIGQLTSKEGPLLNKSSGARRASDWQQFLNRVQNGW
jgi:hypothetical protein